MTTGRRSGRTRSPSSATTCSKLASVNGHTSGQLVKPARTSDQWPLSESVVIVQGEGLHQCGTIEDDTIHTRHCHGCPCNNSRNCGDQAKLPPLKHQWS